MDLFLLYVSNWVIDYLFDFPGRKYIHKGNDAMSLFTAVSPASGRNCCINIWRTSEKIRFKCVSRCCCRMAPKNHISIDFISDKPSLIVLISRAAFIHLSIKYLFRIWARWWESESEFTVPSGGSQSSVRYRRVHSEGAADRRLLCRTALYLNEGAGGGDWIA